MPPKTTALPACTPEWTEFWSNRSTANACPMRLLRQSCPPRRLRLERPAPHRHNSVSSRAVRDQAQPPADSPTQCAGRLAAFARKGPGFHGQPRLPRDAPFIGAFSQCPGRPRNAGAAVVAARLWRLADLGGADAPAEADAGA